uniref:Uncharacterized protein n=1 Tax=Arundo donax TaxID=35708 RepID=A0A0A9D9R2_ARUDO
MTPYQVSSNLLTCGTNIVIHLGTLFRYLLFLRRQGIPIGFT